jgi:hypothetical protein
MGKIYQKRYPWMDPNLYIRMPALLIREVNQGFGARNCEVRPVVFAPQQPGATRATKKSQDLGPLGIFATRDVKEGDIVMVDQCLTGISDVPSRKLQHCDACHSSWLCRSSIPPI